MAVYPTTKTEIGLSGQQATFEKGADQILADASPSGFNSWSRSGNLITHDAGNLDEYFDTVGTKISASVVSQHDGDFGMEVTLSDTTASYSRILVGNPSGGAVLSLWINPNSYTTTDSAQTEIYRWYDAVGGNKIYWIYLTKVGTDYKIGSGHRTDGGSSVDDGSIVISDGWHLIDFYAKRATAGGANDGIVRLWVDGAEETNVTNIDNDTISYTQQWVGMPGTGAAALGGSYYIDTLIYDSIVSASFASTDAAMIGPYGIRFSVIDSTTQYGTLSDVSESASAEINFYFDPNSLTMATNDAFLLVWVLNDAGAVTNFSLTLKKTATDYVVFATDTDLGNTSEYDLADGENEIKLKWESASSGFLSLFIDGEVQETLSGDNSGRLSGLGRFGATSGIDATTRGIFYLDHITWDVYTDVSADVQAGANISAGIRSQGPAFRVAPPGRFNFALNNSDSNANSTAGYWSPGHGSAVAGFEIGAKVRHSIAYDGTTSYVFVGTIKDINVAPGQYLSQITNVVVGDFMHELAKRKISRIAVQLSQRADQLVDTIVDTCDVQPTRTNYATGPDTFTTALYDVRDEKTTFINVLAKVMKSGLGYLFDRCDANGGGVLTYQSRHTRASGATSQVTLSGTMTGLEITRADKNIYNDVNVTIQPAKTDAAATTVLYTSNNEISLAPGQTLFINARYRDPNSEAGTRVAGTEIVDPVADTDYKMSSVSGSGNDFNSSLGIKLTKGGNSSLIQLTNNAAATGYVNLLQLRGKGIYFPDKETVQSFDQDSNDTHGNRQLFYTAPYQDSVNVGQDFADHLKGTYKDPYNDVKSVSFNANRNATFMAAARDLGPGDMITLTETQTGLSSEDFFINGVDYDFQGGNIINVRWILEPKVASDVFILNDSVFGKLNTSKLGF
jgi:hypothetical protein